MNQILSVEMPKNNSGNTYRPNGGTKKVDTKTIIIIFSILLLVLGIAMIALGIFSNSTKEELADGNAPKIEISQNAGELDVEISAQSVISSVQYKWNDEEAKQATLDGTNSLNLNLEIPSGANTFYIEVTDSEGIKNEYANQYIGPEKLNATLNFDESTNKLQIICQEQEVITTLSYKYDNEEEESQEVNSKNAQVDIPIKQGEHDLTVKVQYQDLSSKQMTKKVYFPVVEKVQLSEDKNSFILKATDVRKITKVKINFNDVETEEEVGDEVFQKTLQLKNGDNRLILTVYNSEGVSITTKTRWIKE